MLPGFAGKSCIAVPKPPAVLPAILGIIELTDDTDDSDKTHAARKMVRLPTLVDTLLLAKLCWNYVGRTKDDPHEPHEGASHRQARH